MAAQEGQSIFDALKSAIRAEEPVVLATIVSGGRDRGATPNSGVANGTGPSGSVGHDGAKLFVRASGEFLGSLGNSDLDRVVIRDAIGELAAGTSGVRHYGPAGEARQDELSIFIESFAPPPQMLIFGAVDFTAALCRVAKVLGYRVTVCDARPVFATARRFPYADEIVVDWPHRLLGKVGANLGPRDAVCILTHDPKFDVPAAIAALETNVGYLGAMGSRRTTEDRSRRLSQEGVSQEDLNRIMAPIGLDLGGRTPEETAISICAEIIAERAGRGAPSLRDSEGDIHR